MAEAWFSFLAVGRNREDMLEELKFVAEDIDGRARYIDDIVKDFDELCYHNDEELLVYIEVTNLLDCRSKYKILDEKNLFDKIEEAKKRFKESFGIEGKVMLVSIRL